MIAGWRLKIMKRIVVLGVLILGCSVSARAQAFGGSIGGGSLNGPSFPTLVSTPPAHFAVSRVRGTDADFIPSSFRSFDQAVAEGKTALAAQARTLAQIAEENSRTQKSKARLAIVQDASGNVILTFNR
jgi:hypothetical protein